MHCITEKLKKLTPILETNRFNSNTPLQETHYLHKTNSCILSHMLKKIDEKKWGFKLFK